MFDMGAGSKCSIGDALWICSTMLAGVASKLTSKRVFLFSDDDQPVSLKSAQGDHALQRAKDLADNYVDLYCHLVQRSGHAFNADAFWVPLVLRSLKFNSVDDDGARELIEERVGVAPSEFIDKLRAEVRKKEFKKRALTHFALRLGRVGGRSVECGVDLFSKVVQAKKGTSVPIDARHNTALKTDTRQICADTGTLLIASQIKHALPYGGARVVFAGAEMAKIRLAGNNGVGIEILGFKPRVTLTDDLNVRAAQFLYPNESMKGGTRMFAALLEQMLALDRIAIAVLCIRTNAPPRLVALLPQRERMDAHDTHVQLEPPGFAVIALPFADDVRPLQFPKAAKLRPELLAEAKAVVRGVTVRSLDLPDPALQQFYENLQTLALDQGTATNVVDRVEPFLSDFKAVSSHTAALQSLAFPPDYEPKMPKTPTAGKRARYACVRGDLCC
jgi:ATP-dependent DNA helicase 2 subunit 1